MNPGLTNPNVIGHGLLLDTPRAPEATGTIRMGVAAPHSGATVPSYGPSYFALTELVVFSNLRMHEYR